MVKGDISARKHKRILFSAKEGVRCDLVIGGSGDGKIRANIMNLSQGGVGLSVRKDEGAAIHEGSRITIAEILGLEDLRVIENVSMEVRWVLKDDILAHMGMGCQFMDMSSDALEKVQSFINTRNR